MPTVKIDLLPKQHQFLNSPKKFVMYSGGRGSGKSQVLCYAALRQAVIPFNEVLLVRKTRVDLMSTTLISLLGGENPVIPPSYIEAHNKSEGTIKIKGGGVIRYRGLDKGTSVRSVNSGCLCIDEVCEFTEEELEELYYGLRSPYGSRQVYMATNPGIPSPDNFLYRKFFIEKNDDHEVITSSSYENPYLPPDFFEMFKHMSPSRKKQMVEGIWCSIEGVVFDNFDRTRHCRHLVDGKYDVQREYDSHILSIDWGITHSTAMILCGVKGTKISVLEEFGTSHMLIKQIKDKIVQLKEKYRNLEIYYDPSAPILANELGNIGINLIKANNDRQVGIDRIRNHLGENTLEIDYGCEKLIREFENLTFQRNSDKPVKFGDDFLDALRYCVNAIDDDQGLYVYPKFLEMDEETENFDMWSEENNMSAF